MTARADMILTSPPYDNLRIYGGYGFEFDRVADACVKVLRPGGVLVWIVADATIDGSETGTSFRHALGFMERGLYLHDTMIYKKKHGVPIENKGRYRSVFEYMFVFSAGQARHYQSHCGQTDGEARVPPANPPYSNRMGIYARGHPAGCRI